MPDDFIAYLLDGKIVKSNRAFSVAPDRDTLIERYADAKEKEQEQDGSGFKELTIPSAPIVDGFPGLLDRALHLGLSQSHLITISNAARPIFRDPVSKFQVLDPVIKQATLLEKNDSYSLYGLTPAIYQDFVVRMRRLDSLDEALRDLPGTILMGIVATFDAFVADSVREMLKRYPERYTSSDREVKVKDVLLHGSFEDFISSMIDDDVYNFTRGSHEDQVRFIERSFDIPISAHWKRYADYIEVFERRNLIAHGERAFNQRYVRVCVAAGHKGAEALIGQPVKLTATYLKQAADVLVEFAIVLIFTLWRKHDSTTEMQAFDKLNVLIFELIQSRRYRPAVFIATAALEIKKSSCTQLTRGMLTVNLASAQKHLKQDEAAMKTLDTIDWSAAADKFQICVASIRQDNNAINALLPQIAAAKSITEDAFRTWPVFSFIRENHEFEKSFEAAFGEPFVRVKDDLTATINNTVISEADSIH